MKDSRISVSVHADWTVIVGASLWGYFDSPILVSSQHGHYLDCQHAASEQTS
jgi:hypothetical protein